MTTTNLRIHARRFMRYTAAALHLALRLYLANVFWKAGLTKIASWETTLALFSDEYRVPLLSAAAAAVLATGIELTLPVALVIGLYTRTSAAILFVFNLVAALSYPDISDAGIVQHAYWGTLLLVIASHEGTTVSLDAWRCRRARA